ncbi:MAG: tyrosyl-tRNA synthetase [Granulosicoccus sp.]|jgi:tyrosyl-tRNA synthetase
MNFIEELKWRGMLQDSTPGVEEHLTEKMRAGYIGFDPTAPALTLGNFVQIQILRLFQLSGNKPVVLMGGATGRIGDPSGKDKERILKSFDELDKNLESQKTNFYKFLDFDCGENSAIMRNNIDFYNEMNVLDFLRDVGKTLTVSYMMSKDSVKNRLETGLSFTEFSYQLLQSYDFQRLFENDDVTLQMGGSDQWGNITSGTEFIRRNLSAKAYAVTTPLLTKSDGKKFGKSEQGNIWLDAAKTSPYKFYQFWINADDKDIQKFTRYFTLKSHEEIEARETELAENPREQKRLLAEELTVRVHGQEAHDAAQNVSNLLFKKADKATLLEMDEGSLEVVSFEIPSFRIKKDVFDFGVNIIQLLTDHTSILPSKGEARRSIKGNSISVNKVKISSHEAIISSDSLLHGKYLMVENGKKNKYIITIADARDLDIELE